MEGTQPSFAVAAVVGQVAEAVVGPYVGAGWVGWVGVLGVHMPT